MNGWIDGRIKRNRRLPGAGTKNNAVKRRQLCLLFITEGRREGGQNEEGVDKGGVGSIQWNE